MDLEILAHQLQTARLEISDSQIEPPRVVRIVLPLNRIVSLADFLAHRFQARPELILAEDTRRSAEHFTLRYIFALDGHDAFVIVTTFVPAAEPTFPSLATRWYLASRFEREIHDLFGLTPREHPDLRRLPLHQFWPTQYHPLLQDATPPREFVDDGTPYPFRRVEGEGIFEITVGPVHAGIIEPGHFRFSVEGETIINLESRLYFVHKGIEKQFETLPLPRAVELAERISGDSSFAHALAFCQALENSAGVMAPPRALFLRVVLLELERLYNHIADVGAILTDTGYAVANAHAMRLREEVLRLNARLTGHRLLRGMVTPGGMARDMAAEQLRDVTRTTTRVLADFDEVVAIALRNGFVMDRLRETGRLTNRTARELQVVGVPARASGIDADARRDHPFAAYDELSPQVVVFQEGDVWARLMVRVQEAREAVRLIARAVEQMPSGEVAAPLPRLDPGASAFGLVEGWRGPIWHWVVAGESDAPARVKVLDPSFNNWTALHYAILKNIVPDFPLCNKSFNLSYAGNDL
jgi:formate hydrogenlyase subunit 5